MVKTIDGRQISYKLSGDPNGTPLVLLHGMGASASFTDSLDSLFRRKKTFAISIDRPGTAESSYFVEKNIYSYIELLHTFIHTLTEGPFMLMGWSAGGYYAQAYSICYPEDVSHLSLISSAIPFMNKKAKNLLPFRYQALLKLNNFIPSWTEKLFKKTAHKLILNPDIILHKAMKFLSSPDFKTASDPMIYSLFKRNAIESYSQEGKGPYFDAMALANKEEIPLKNIKIPTHIWHGLRDSILPTQFAHYLHSEITGSTVFEISGQGHFLYLNYMEKIMERAKL